MKNYIMTDTVVNGLQVVKITDGPFQGVEFCYGKVALEENEETNKCRLNFECDIISGDPKDIAAFKELIGGILIGMIEEQLEQGSLIYSGGTDEEMHYEELCQE